MKGNIGKYKVVDKLPGNAMTVKEYAESKNISQSYIYKMIERNKADFQMITFKTINFVIPLTND